MRGVGGRRERECTVTTIPSLISVVVIVDIKKDERRKCNYHKTQGLCFNRGGQPDRIRVGSVQYDPCLLWKNGAETDAGSRIRHILSGPILAARWP